MAASLPNPRDLKSWEDAFQHPLPTVRKLEQQLRSNAAENREKLRSLVGGSYRDLLGTAERICDMDETMQAIETSLGLTASKCNSGVVDKIFANAAKLNTERTRREAQRNGLAAQLSVLRNCHSCMTQFLKQDDQLHPAAKVLILGRLMHKMLSQQADAPPLVDGLRGRLALSESRLLKNLNRTFSDPSVEGQHLVMNMCAFSLATSSVPTDVLYHFLKVRLEAVRNLSTVPNRARSNMVEAIQLFKTSLSATQWIFPKRLAEALAKVKLQPLLQDKDVRSLSELNLEIYERWIPDDVRSFTPWPRHDELQKSDAQKITRSWVPAAISALETALEDILQEQNDFEAVLGLRTAVLEAHLISTDQAPATIVSEVLDLIRKVFNKRLCELVKQKAGGVLALVGQIKTTFDTSTTTSHSNVESLWDLVDEGTNLDNGSVAFKESIRSRLHGSDGAVRSCIEMNDAWATAITQARSQIQNMKERRWEDDMLDAGADEDDLDLESQQVSLGEDDPRILDDALNESLVASLIKFSAEVGALIEQGGPTEGAIFLVRVLRDLAQKTAGLSTHFDHASLSQRLFSIIGASVAQDNIATYSAALNKLAQIHRLPAVGLWEGHPALPSQPMTETFKLLHNLTRGMAASGQDLWTPALIASLKTDLAMRLGGILEAALEAIRTAPQTQPITKAVNGLSNGDGDQEKPNDEDTNVDVAAEVEDSSTSADKSAVEDEQTSMENGHGDGSVDPVASSTAEIHSNETDILKIKAQQLLFDILYLERVLIADAEGVSSNHLQKATDAALALAELPIDQQERMRKNANDYWRKTYLLFGLLM